MQVVYFSFSLVYIHSFILTQMIAYSVTGCKPVSSLKNVSSKIFLAFWPSKNILFIVLHFVLLINLAARQGEKKKKQRFCKIFDLILHTVIFYTYFRIKNNNTKLCHIYFKQKVLLFFYQAQEPFCFKAYDTCKDLLAVVACKKHFLDHKNNAPTWTIITVLVILTTSDAMCSLNSFTVI